MTGKRLLWLHTYAERLQDSSTGHGAFVPEVDGIGWDTAVTEIPVDNSAIMYSSSEEAIIIGTGKIVGVSQAVWDYSVSGMRVVAKWLSYRTKSGAGRSTSSASKLDQMRPHHWADEWNDELLDLLRIIKMTIDMQADLANLLREICAGELIPTSELPVPKKLEREVPTQVTMPLFE